MRNIVIYLGLALAGVLFALGIRDLKINRKKPGPFISTVLMALYLLGSRYAGAAESAKSVSETTMTRKDRMHITELIKTKEWQNFKAFWKRLDEIVPNKDKVKSEKELSYFGEYFGAINAEEGNKLEKEVGGVIADLKKNEQQGVLNLAAFNLLERICMARINYIVRGFRSMVTRMVPSPSLVNEEKSLINLERNIDLLLLLKSKNKVSTDEFNQVFANIQGEIKAFSILNTKNSYYSRSYSLNEQDMHNTSGKDYNIEAYIASFTREYDDYKEKRKIGKISAEKEKYYQNLDIKYEETIQALTELKLVLPLINELIADLEQ